MLGDDSRRQKGYAKGPATLSRPEVGSRGLYRAAKRASVGSQGRRVFSDATHRELMQLLVEDVQLPVRFSVLDVVVDSQGNTGKTHQSGRQASVDPAG